jgi:hypothetical protein
MTPQTTTKSSRADSDEPIRRRGLLAVAVAFVAGMVARLSEAPLQALSGGGDQGFFALGSNPWYIAGSPAPNAPAISSAPTVLQASPNFGNFLGFNGADPVVFEADARQSAGAVHAIYGRATAGYGLVGFGAFGVYGSGTNTGVYGIGTSTGVFGASNTTGVSGIGASADIAIDADFAAVVDLSDYHVFLTGRGGGHLLQVTEQSASGFVVEADGTFAALKGKQGSDLSGAFSWRVVAKRKDITGARLEPVTIPPAPILPPVPELPTEAPPAPRVQR